MRSQHERSAAPSSFDTRVVPASLDCRKSPKSVTMRLVPSLQRTAALPVPSAKAVAARPRGVRQFLQAMAETRENNEFLPAHLEILDTPVSPKGLAFLWVILLMMTCAGVWSFVARLDIFAVAPGRIQPSGRSKVVQPFETSKVKAILVGNGATVKAGTPLILLDATDPNADLVSKREILQALDAVIASRKAMISALEANLPQVTPKFPDGIPEALRIQETSAMQADFNQYVSTRESSVSLLAEKQATVQRLVVSIAARERLRAVLQERADMKQALVASSSGTRAAVIDAVQQLDQAATDLAFDQGQLGEAKAAVASIGKQLSQLKSETLAKQAQILTQALEKRPAASFDVIKASLRNDRMTLSSPIDGTVQQLAVTTIGQVVTPSQPLLVVVPSGGPIEVEALVPNKDIGFIVPGQAAVVKVDAFPFTRYGAIEGTVSRISRDAIDNKEATTSGDATSVAQGQSVAPTTGTPQTSNLVYPVTIELKRASIVSDGRNVPLTPGMTVNVEIRTGNRRVIDYLISPIVETTSTAGHER